MYNLIKQDIVILFLGGLFSLLLTVVIIIIKQEYKRNIEKERLEIQKKFLPESVGDIEAKLNDSFEYRKLKFTDLLTIWGLQPLFIINFINLFVKHGVLEIIIAFILVLFVIIHEFHAAIQYSANIKYKLLILTVWVVLFLLFNLN